MAVKAQLDRLAAFEPAPYPVVSLYLNTQPGQTGRVEYRGSSWTARNAGSLPIEAGSEAAIAQIEGLTLHIKSE